MDLLDRLALYISKIRRVSCEYGIPPVRQISQISHLLRSLGRIGPGDYYAYRLFDDSLTLAEKEEFVGWRAEPRLDALNDRAWHCLGLDKVLMYGLFHSVGIRFPETRAIYFPGQGRPLAGATVLKSFDELCAWLRTPSNYPFFSKPSASGFARGAFYARGYDQTTDSILFKDGTSLKLTEFDRHFHDIEHLGYLFQTPIQADLRLVGALGDIVSSLRMMVLYDEHEGPLLHRCFWKLPTGNNMYDNYDGGRSGNLAAAIDTQTGRITRAITGFGLDVVDVAHHPDTGVPLNTLSVPDWDHVVDFTLNAALSLPKLRFQQWDISLAEGGPMALEVNLFGTAGGTVSQLVYRKGLLDDTMQAFLHRHHARTRNMTA